VRGSGSFIRPSDLSRPLDARPILDHQRKRLGHLVRGQGGKAWPGMLLAGSGVPSAQRPPRRRDGARSTDPRSRKCSLRSASNSVGNPSPRAAPRTSWLFWSRLPRGRMKIWGLSKERAKYRPAPAPEVRCDRCRYMFPRLAFGGCRLVRGAIRSSATCDEFTARGAREG